MNSILFSIWDRVFDPTSCKHFIMPLMPMSMPWQH